MQTLRTTKTSRRSVRPLHIFFEIARDPRKSKSPAWPLLLRWTVQTRILTIPRLSWSYTQLVVVAEPAGSAPYGAPGDLNNLVELSLNNLAQKQQFWRKIEDINRLHAWKVRLRFARVVSLHYGWARPARASHNSYNLLRSWLYYKIGFANCKIDFVVIPKSNTIHAHVVRPRSRHSPRGW